MELIQQQLVVKQYRTLKKLGEGAIVTVYLAQDQQTFKMFTLKVQKHNDDPVHMAQANQAFIQEICALEQAKHPFILEIVESFQWEDADKNLRWCIVLEHADGGDLYESYIKSNTQVKQKLAFTWFAMISLALAHLNSLGLNSSDISPKSIGICGEKYGGGFAKIADMGFVSVDYTDQDDFNPIRYYAPELYRGKDLSKKSVWSIGVLLYEVLTGGKHPFLQDFKNETYLQRLPELEIRPHPLIGQEAMAMLKLLLEKKESDRVEINQVLCLDQVKKKIMSFLENLNHEHLDILFSQATKLFKEDVRLKVDQAEVSEEDQPQAQMVMLPQSNKFDEGKLKELIQRIRQDGHAKLAGMIERDGELIERLRVSEDASHTAKQMQFEGVKDRPGFCDLLPGIYYGQCLDEVRDGYGVLYCIIEGGIPSFYECEWNKGIPTKGKRIWIANDKWEKFEGAMDDKYLSQGAGQQQFEEGDRYQGEFKRGDMHGKGKYTFSNGDYQEGQYECDKAIGVHKYFSKEGQLILLRTYDKNGKIIKTEKVK
ncbi:hypothetical protein FGO68_gene3590 [Halteria grandinella]|uniref:Protein kinase domain-containing protein n=1 Tax=Halteria grandinella TaxID=5974 RepID=A0A8J8T3K0_HALGN|nr:hypothetical protein FGO68_gene3590 [Halteria grandinella]